VKSQSLLPTKIDGRDLVKTIKQTDPLDLAIWKLMADGKKRTREDVATALREFGFRREDVDDRMSTLYCSSNRRWFDAQGRNKNTTYQLRKNRLERPFSRGGIDFESISNIRDILVIDEESKHLFEELQSEYAKETEMTQAKPSAPPMPDDDAPIVADPMSMNAHNWFSPGKPAPQEDENSSDIKQQTLTTPGAFGSGVGLSLTRPLSAEAELVEHFRATQSVADPKEVIKQVADNLDAGGYDSSKLRAASTYVKPEKETSNKTDRPNAENSSATETTTQLPQADQLTVRFYLGDDLETRIVRLLKQTNRVLALRDLTDLLPGFVQTAIDYRIRKLVTLGVVTRVEEGEGNERRIHYHFNDNDRYTRAGQELIDRTSIIEYENTGLSNGAAVVELAKYRRVYKAEQVDDSNQTQPAPAAETETKPTAEEESVMTSTANFDLQEFVQDMGFSTWNANPNWYRYLCARHLSNPDKVLASVKELHKLDVISDEELMDSLERVARGDLTPPDSYKGDQGEKLVRNLGVLAEVSSKPADPNTAFRAVGEMETRPGVEPPATAAVEVLVDRARERMGKTMLDDLRGALVAIFDSEEKVDSYVNSLTSDNKEVKTNALVELITSLPTGNSDKSAHVHRLLASAPLTVAELPQDGGLGFALDATGLSNKPYVERSVPALALVVDQPDETKVPFSKTPLIVVRGMLLTGEEAKEIKDFIEGISEIPTPSVLKSAKIEIQGRSYTFEQIEDIGIELLAMFN